jgi:hypothetical protein
LAIDGEQILALPSLAVPDAAADVESVSRSDAVTLFVERARRVDADFVLSAANSGAVSQVCRRLDGVPLAIELAAARVNAMTLPELARGLDHRFETLAGGRRGAVQRHETLRAAVDWSYDLLSEAERRLLARLSVFSGGCTRESAEAVCGWDPIDASQVFALLRGLVARSLVVADREGPDTRYRLLETIREYGEDRLAGWAETEMMRTRHGENYLHLAQQLSEAIDGPNETAAVSGLMAEHENLLSASANAVDTGNVDVALGLWTSHWGHPYTFTYLPPLPLEAFELTGAADHRLYPAALASAAWLAAVGGDLRAAQDRCAAAIEAAERLDIHDPFLDYLVKENLAAALSMSGSLAAAAMQYQRAADVARSAGLSTALPWSLVSAALQYLLLGDRGRALPFAAKALPFARRIGMPSLLASSLNVIAAAMLEEDPEEARTYLRDGTRIDTSFGLVGHASIIGLITAAETGEWERVVGLFGPLIRFCTWRNDVAVLGISLAVLARAIVRTDSEASARLQGAARSLMTPSRHDDPQYAGQAAPDRPAAETSGNVGLVAGLYRETSAVLREVLGEARLRELRAEGAEMDVDQIVVVADAAIAGALSTSQP